MNFRNILRVLNTKYSYATLILLLSINLKAQTDSSQFSNQKDITDIICKVSRHFDFTERDTSNKNKHQFHLSILPVIGYSIQTGIMGGITSIATFVNNKHINANISNIMATLAYTEEKQTIAILQPNIWTKNNTYNITGIIQYLKFPQDTYGLGGNSTFDDANDIDYKFFKVNLALLKQIIPDFFAGLGYALDYHWNIKEQGIVNGATSDFKKYGLNNQSISAGITVNILYDNRRNSINPQKGFYANIVYRPNFKLMGSDQNWESLLLDFRKYVKFPSGSKNILAFWNYNWLTLSGKPPYLDLPSTGCDANNNIGRGYMQGRFTGLNMVYLETEYRFGLTKNGLFGGVVFANSQSFTNWPQNFYTSINPGYGCGIRLKINKHSNTNMALDYGFGTKGSHGLFLNLCELF